MIIRVKTNVKEFIIGMETVSIHLMCTRAMVYNELHKKILNKVFSRSKR